MQVIKTILKAEAGEVLIDIPDSFGEEVEVIILPVRERYKFFISNDETSRRNRLCKESSGQ